MPSTQRKGTGLERVKRWTPAQLGAFRAALDQYAERKRFLDEPWLVVGMLLTLSGLRRSEVLGLPKTDNSRRTVLAGEIHDGYGFTRALKALWLPPDRYSRAFVRVCDEAGVPRLSRVHNVRHSLALALQANGVPDH